MLLKIQTDLLNIQKKLKESEKQLQELRTDVNKLSIKLEQLAYWIINWSTTAKINHNIFPWEETYE